MDATADMRNIKNIKLTCDHATIDGLTLDIAMLPANGKQQEYPEAEATTSYLPLIATQHAEDQKFHLLLAASGSVATIKIPNIILGLSQHPNLAIRVILTESATNFLQGQSAEQPNIDTIAKYPNVDAIYRDMDEWKIPWKRGAPILHIELRRWADLLVIAPLSANTLAKISNGFSDNLLTSVVRAWQVEDLLASSAQKVGTQTPLSIQKRIIIAPAMNTAMWRHPLTSLHLQPLAQDQLYHWFDVLRPVEKTLACGDIGDGAMCDWREIVSAIKEIASKHSFSSDQHQAHDTLVT